jgi:ferredoxin/mannose-6-phosphate isomerase-like protein (cupin superfamily)
MERKGVEEARARENGWELPVHCIDIHKSAHNGQPFRLHYHDYIELLYGLSGESQAVIGEKSYTMRKGDLIVVNPGEAHDVRVEEGEGNYYVIKFLPELLYSQGKSLVGIRYLLSLWQDEIAFAPAFRAEEIGESGIDGFFTPVMKFRSHNPDQEQYCFQDCTKCSQVCPTGALRPITVEEKKRTPIGIAVVDHKKCIAWENNEYCAVCDEYCPFKAIKLVKRKDVMCPIVEADKCRGCGACESACPAEPIAISIKPI